MSGRDTAAGGSGSAPRRRPPGGRGSGWSLRALLRGGGSPTSAGAREAVLAAIRRAAPLEVPLAELPAVWLTAAERARAATAGLGAEETPSSAERELVRLFSEALAQAGGRAMELPGPEALAPAVAQERGGRQAVVSAVPGLAISTLAVGPDSTPERLSGIELAVVPGRFGVAENGAVWVSEADLPHRALPFIAEHLVLVLPKREIVADMHEAYRRMPRPLPGYGVFVSGPSKTADIEQALVIGAHGPRGLLVLLT